MADQRRSSGTPRRRSSLARSPLRGGGFDELSRALEVARRDEDLARPAAPGGLPGTGTHVGLPVAAGDPLGPQQTRRSPRPPFRRRQRSVAPRASRATVPTDYGGQHERHPRRERALDRHPRSRADGHEARGDRLARLRRPSGQGLLRAVGVAAGYRLRHRRELPGRAIDASRVGDLDHLRQRSHDGCAGHRFRACTSSSSTSRRPATSSSIAASRSARCSTTPSECSTTPVTRDASPARIRNAATTARLPRSATRTATTGCSRRSNSGLQAGEPVADAVGMEFEEQSR